jgi:hypothetical protein
MADKKPRPKGTQKGVVKRDNQHGPFNFGGKARTPWLSPKTKKKGR